MLPAPDPQQTPKSVSPELLRRVEALQAEIERLKARSRKPSPEELLNENEVVDHIRNFLRANGYSEILVRHTGETGTDISATHQEQHHQLVLECKGETSSKEGSPRFGKGFRSGMVRDSVANAVYRAMKDLSAKDAVAPSAEGRKAFRVAVAFPASPTYRRYVVPIKPLLDVLQIAVFLVQKSGAVAVL